MGISIAKTFTCQLHEDEVVPNISMRFGREIYLIKSLQTVTLHFETVSKL